MQPLWKNKCRLLKTYIYIYNIKHIYKLYSSNPTAGYISKGNKTDVSKRYLHYFIELLFTVAKICPMTNECIKNMGRKFMGRQMIEFIVTRNPDSCNNMRESEGHYDISHI